MAEASHVGHDGSHGRAAERVIGRCFVNYGKSGFCCSSKVAKEAQKCRQKQHGFLGVNRCIPAAR